MRTIFGWEMAKSGSSSVGRARPCQGRGREFEPRFPLSIPSQWRGSFFKAVLVLTRITCLVVELADPEKIGKPIIGAGTQTSKENGGKKVAAKRLSL
jgi:hypothetical protein